jgi:hypothetical protein
MKVYENIALSRAILSRRGISQDSTEYEDYLKIREMCQKTPGYVGILTRLRFEDGVSDMQELEHILQTLVVEKIDLAQISKMSYEQILSLLLDRVEKSSDTKDLELIFKDNEYSYYRVYTYEGILKIGSPAWCLKTKSRWIDYQKSHPEQWVVIQNSYRNRIITPENNYLSEYKSKDGWIRYGISINHNSGDIIGFSDNNGQMDLKFFNWTYLGVVETCLNLSRGIRKSFYDYFEGTTKISKNWHRIDNIKRINGRLNTEMVQLSDGKYYIGFPNKYEGAGRIIALENKNFCLIIPLEKDSLNDAALSSPEVLSLVDDGIKDIDLPLYDGIKLSRGTTTLDKIKKRREFLLEFENWIIYKLPESYLVVRYDLNEEIPMIAIDESKRHYPDRLPYFYVDPNKWKIFILKNMKIQEEGARIIQEIKKIENIPTTQVDVPKNVTETLIDKDEKTTRGFIKKFKDWRGK